MSSCPAKPAKEKKFGVAICRERKCIDLQKDPKWPDSPQQCVITHGMPGSMSCCIKEISRVFRDAEKATVSMNTDHPIRIECVVDEIALEFLVAPRIEKE